MDLSGNLIGCLTNPAFFRQHTFGTRAARVRFLFGSCPEIEVSEQL